MVSGVHLKRCSWQDLKKKIMRMKIKKKHRGQRTICFSASCLVCGVLSCVLCCVVSCRVALSCVVLCCLVLSYVVLSCLVMPSVSCCPVLSCLLSCDVLSCRVLSCLVLLCLVLSLLLKREARYMTYMTGSKAIHIYRCRVTTSPRICHVPYT